MTEALDRKRRQLAEREELLLDIAQDVVASEGFAGLTMEKIASRSPYSKGTVYNHFGSKEDLFCALGFRSLKMLKVLFDRAQQFPEFSRAQLLANAYAYQLFSRLEPALFMSVLTAKTPAVLEKAKPERIEESVALEHTVMQTCDRAVDIGLASGDLSDQKAKNVAGVTFACWSSAFGTIALQQNAALTIGVQRVEAQDEALLYSLGLVLDGLGWRPLSTEYDYRKLWQQLGEEIFSDELAQINGDVVVDEANSSIAG